MPLLIPFHPTTANDFALVTWVSEVPAGWHMEAAGPYIGVSKTPPIWVPNYQFVATLQYESAIKGRSSVRFEFRVSNIALYTLDGNFPSNFNPHRLSYVDMTLSGFDLMLKQYGLNIDGRGVRGRWTFEKRGQNYQIVLA